MGETMLGVAMFAFALGLVAGCDLTLWLLRRAAQRDGDGCER